MSEYRLDVPVDGGKYRVTVDQQAHLRVLRHDKPWWDVEEGAKCVIALACELEEVRQQTAKLKKLVEAQEKLLVCYRIGKHPSDKLLDTISKLKIGFSKLEG